MKSKLFKLSITIAFCFSIAVMLYVSPYMATSQIFKAAGDENKEHIIAFFMDKPKIKENVMTRIVVDKFFDDIAKEENLNISESNIHMALEAMVHETPVSLMFAEVREGMKDKTLKVNYLYDGFNKFIMIIEDDSDKNYVTFKRDKLMFWKIIDIK